MSEQITPLLQRHEEEKEDLQMKAEDEEEGLLQAGGRAVRSDKDLPELSARIQSMRAGGRPLPETERAFYGSRFGYDFSSVRIHTDSQANETARAVNARAFTLDRDVVFGAGAYSPSTEGGRRLLAHELTHVVQQRDVSTLQLRTERGSGYRVDDSEDCSGNWQDLGVALNEASRMVNEALRSLRPRVRTAERIRTALSTHFHLDQEVIDGGGNISGRERYRLLLKLVRVERNFRSIKNAFSGTIPFECEGTNDGWFCKTNSYGYVRLIWSDIHICPHWFGMGPQDQARGIVHEMSHKYAGTDDEAYEHNPAYRNLSVDDAIDNADSYACFARDVS